MIRTIRPWLVRSSLLAVISLALPLKSWLAKDWWVPDWWVPDGWVLKNELAKNVDLKGSVGTRPSDVQSPDRSDDGQASESNYDLTRPGHSVLTPAGSMANHSPSLAALDDGSLVMSWFGGSREGARDVQIFFASFDGAQWSDARAIVGVDQLMKQTGRYLTKLGNPVLYFDAGRLHCWFVSVSLGGWGGARLNHMVSLDGGKNWTQPKLLVASPFLNVSTLVRSTALPASSEVVLSAPAQSLVEVSRETLLPAYFELSHKYPVMLRVDRNSEILDRYPFGGKTGLLQPSVVRVVTSHKITQAANAAPANPTRPGTENPSDTLVAFFRRGQTVPEEKVFTSRSLDQGQTWSDAQALGIPNGDASVAAWADQTKIWLIANPELQSRRSIASFKLPDSLPFSTALAPAQILDQAPAALPGHQEFSYPSFARTRDGRLHLVYTADGRKGIRHRIWAPQPEAEAPKAQKP